MKKLQGPVFFNPSLRGKLQRWLKNCTARHKCWWFSSTTSLSLRHLFKGSKQSNNKSVKCQVRSTRSLQPFDLSWPTGSSLRKRGERKMQAAWPVCLVGKVTSTCWDSASGNIQLQSPGNKPRNCAMPGWNDTAEKTSLSRSHMFPFPPIFQQQKRTKKRLDTELYRDSFYPLFLTTPSAPVSDFSRAIPFQLRRKSSYMQTPSIFTAWNWKSSLCTVRNSCTA